ncbi:MAG: TIGR03986 family CRISPR-associated RAMP protein, partial [Bacteriovoracaceae bacterium]|nr:TIGR03986 family CRISPR-associated RAMP protein [Bacteriovoracaceae bacterium]
MSFADLRDGFLTLGGLGAIGYGSVETVEFMEKPSWFELPDRNTAMIDFSDKRMQFSFSEPKIENNVIYHPHTFLKPPERNVVREKDPVSHIKNKDAEGNPLWSGKIRCSLTTRGPVFIPDTNNDDYFDMKEKYPDHKNYGFFRINNEPAIPGSSIRGMISSVYEALTNSCFRVMDQARYLTRSEKPDPDEEFLPGKIVRKNDGSLSILEMEEFLRLPLYDVEDNINKINEKDFSSINQQKLKAAMDCNKKIAEAAEHNRIFLENNFSSEEREEVLKGKAPVFFVKYSSHGENGYDKDWIAFLTLEKNKKGKKNEKAKKGYIKFTGPSMVNVDSDINKSNAELFPSILEQKDSKLKLWDLVTNCLHNDNEKEGRASQNKKYPRPVLKLKTDTHEYSVLKRCEHVFVKKTSEENIYALPENIRKQYNDLKKDNRDNTKTIPEVFRAWTPHEKLTEGDLVYFKHDKNDKITRITPVRISRGIDDNPMGKRFTNNNDSLRSCHHECIENCDECPELCNKVSDYFSPHPLGLCPACHLFGTALYKGRVGFSTAWLKTDDPVWYKTNNDNPVRGGALTLPLLERPRPTWSMPDKDAKIPGRKFYIHHPWSVDKIKETVVNENNRTIQPVGKDNVFEFDVRFDNLRKWEIGLLIYTLELEDNLAHKLGMGKAHGMGSVQIKTERVLLKHAFKSTANINKHDKEEIINDGFKHLHNNLLSSVCADVLQNEYIKQLRSLLWLPEKNNDIQVRYPTLEKENDVPGYINLQDNLKKNDRLKFLCTPWDKWHDYSKTPA